jgi:argininosuccinate lyase
VSSRIWEKGIAADAAMMRYTARDDWQLDQRLLEHDLVASRAHVRGLGRAGVLADDEVAALVAALDALGEEVAAGSFQLTDADEDGHSAIEAALVATLGEVGKKVHTGRSRNDQVLVAVRLWERQALDDLAGLLTEAGRAFLTLAEREADTPMPGYTHLQRAVPSSLGYWAAAYAEGFADALEAVRGARALVNRSPLGGAAGFGVNLPLDRDGVADELGFAGLSVNPLASQSSRGILEAHVLGAAWLAMAVVRRLAWDLSLFSTSEFGFVKLPDEFTTGSSIMPQKRNPDVVELMRAACSVVQGALAEVQTLVALPSGYHRDLQLTKSPLFRGLDETLATLAMVVRLVSTSAGGGLRFERARMRDAVSAETYATDRAIELTRAGTPFRDAYKQVAAEVLGGDASPLASRTPEESLRARVSPGSPGALLLSSIAARLA